MIRLSGIKPTGMPTLGNYLGAIKQWAATGDKDDIYFIADMHALTTPHNPAKLRSLVTQQLAILLGAGIDPSQVLVQSDLAREIGALTWILESTCSYGEAARMIQFKEKSAGQASIRLSLLTYPVLMAADILLQGAAQVPVGNDQLQHIQLTRVLARRFNQTYGEVFVVPQGVTPPTAARIRDLADPLRKMDKSAANPSGTIFIMDSPDAITLKIARAVTDDQAQVRYAPEKQPGVSNLLEIMSACLGQKPGELAESISNYAALKAETTQVVVETLRPVRERATEFLHDPEQLSQARKSGATRARQRSQHRLDAALRMSGLG